MGLSWLITVAEAEVDWRMSPTDLRQAMQTHWPQAKLVEKEDDWGHLFWSWGKPQDTLDTFFGRLIRDNFTVSVEGDTDAVMEFAIWLRQYVPGEYRLLLSDDLGWHNVLIENNMTIEELQSALSRPSEDIESLLYPQN